MTPSRRRLGSEIHTLEEFDDADLETVKAKERLLQDWKDSDAYRHARACRRHLVRRVRHREDTRNAAITERCSAQTPG